MYEAECLDQPESLAASHQACAPELSGDSMHVACVFVSCMSLLPMALKSFCCSNSLLHNSFVFEFALLIDIL